MMQRAQARETLRSLATGIREASDEERIARLLERVAKAEPEVAAILLEVGAEAALLQADTAAAIDCESADVSVRDRLHVFGARREIS